jgi:AraC family transcriptional regulator
MDLLNAQEQRFDACVVMPAELAHQPLPPVESGMIESGRWAVFLHKGPYDTLWQTWNRIYKHWLPANDMILREEAPFEVYLNNKHVTPPAELLTEIHIPVAQASSILIS